MFLLILVLDADGEMINQATEAEGCEQLGAADGRLSLSPLLPKGVSCCCICAASAVGKSHQLSHVQKF